MTFPAVRLHRQRHSQAIRSLVSETQLRKEDFIAPLFVHEGLKEKRAISSMPGVFQHSLDSLRTEVAEMAKVGIRAVMLFGIPSNKDPQGSESWNPQGIIQKAIALIKKDFPEMIITADCCLCEYTSHGHCGVLEQQKMHNDHTLDILAKIAISYAHAGVDIVVPSGMMDGTVASLRAGLDASGFSMVSIMSHTAKYASTFYGPFREAGGSGDVFTGNRKHHQAAPTQKREALREAQLDWEEGADFMLVKPALPYLDIVAMLHERFPLPIVAYQVSGEYAMLKAGAAAKAFDEKEGFYEACLGIKRAGAQLIISYYAIELAKII
jgi:porphobilinogen synthase